VADGASAAAWEQLVAAHYAAAWGRAGEPTPFDGAKALNLPDDFTVLAYSPSNIRPFWTYATCGMSQAKDEHPVEAIMFAPYSAPGVVELLYAVAHFHRSSPGLKLGDTVNFGRPWMGPSACTFGLVSRPTLDGPHLGEGRLGGRSLTVYWLLPVTPAEVELLKAQGLPALEAAFEQAHLQFARPSRDSTV
jgi:hypothetical protein